MKFRTFTLILLSMCMLSAQAQNRRNLDRNMEYQQYQLIKNYSDSLMAYKLRIDSLLMASDSIGQLYGDVHNCAMFNSKTVNVSVSLLVVVSI